MADQVADLPPRSGDFRFLLIESYSESTAVVDLAPFNDNFVWELTFDSYSDSSDVADQVADLPPRSGDFRFLLINSYTESSDVADQVADLTPPKWQF